MFYLNGSEAYRLRISGTAGTPVAYTNLATLSIGNATYEGPFSIPFTNLHPGTNVFAVEVHQQAASSSDVVFGMALDMLVQTNTSPVGSLLINEVLAANGSLREPDGTTPDWVELYNSSPLAMDLSGFTLTDDAGDYTRWSFPPGTLLGRGEYLRVRCDPDLLASATNTGFGLQESGGAVFLFDPANGGTQLDAVYYGFQTPDFAIGRVPSGGTNWVLTVPTPGTPNVAVGLASPAGLKINEWMAAPTSGDDWFEVYNSSLQPVALGGLHLTDDLNDRTKFMIPPLSFIGAGTNAWLKFTATEVGFSLKASGEALGVATANGTLIDGLAFGLQPAGLSEGRFPDGSEEILPFPATASPGASNYRLLSSVAISEALTHTDAPLQDAIELLNLTDQPVDIGGWWLSDDPGTLQKYQIPYGTTLLPHRFALFQENVFSNTLFAAIPFRLSSQGDEVVLSAVAANVLTGYRATVKFGAAANGVSFGRYLTSDGREEFVAQSERTLGASNAYPKVGPVVLSEIMYRPPTWAPTTMSATSSSSCATSPRRRCHYSTRTIRPIPGACAMRWISISPPIGTSRRAACCWW